MSVLPSLLEYSTETLKHKMDSIVNLGFEEFCEITGLEEMAFHWDIILPQFATIKSVTPTVSFVDGCNVLSEYWGKEHIRLSIHVMGSINESRALLDYIHQFAWPSAWYGEVYVPQAAWDDEYSDFLDRWEVGVWYDVGTYDEDMEPECNELLLMSVVAGQSGQHPDRSVQDYAYTIALEHKDAHIVLDGGWSLDQVPNDPHIDVAMHQGFWSQIDS